VAQQNRQTDQQFMLTQQLLLSVVEQMKLPLMQIARQTELGLCDGEGLETIRQSTQAGLRLLESYTLGVRLAQQQTPLLDMEPVSVSGVLYDVAQQLQPYARAYGVALELYVDGRHGPVMAHRQGLQAALVSLGSALIETIPAHEPAGNALRLSAHRCRYGVVAGVYGNLPGITTQALRTGRQLYGDTRQPLNAFLYTSGAGVFVADALLQAMRSHLSASRYQRQYGLGAILPVNPQLRLV